MLTEGGDLISFCTFADKDDIQPTELTPWIGWVYTFPHYRGHRYVGKLLSYAETLTKADGINSIYISTKNRPAPQSLSLIFESQYSWLSVLKYSIMFTKLSS